MQAILEVSDRHSWINNRVYVVQTVLNSPAMATTRVILFCAFANALPMFAE